MIYTQKLHIIYAPLELMVLIIIFMSSSLIITTHLIIRIIFYSSTRQKLTQQRTGLRRFFYPSYKVIRTVMSYKKINLLGFFLALIYSIIYMWSEGLIVKANMGPVLKTINEGIPGFAPILIFFPFSNIGVIIPIYQIAVLITLSLIIWINSTIIITSMKIGMFSKSNIGVGLTGAFSGLLVACPVCIAPPLIIILSTYISPWIFPLATTIISGLISTTFFYIFSLLLLWIGLSISSNSLATKNTCDIR